MSGLVLSLFDYSGNAVRPWAEAGYECVCIDAKHGGLRTEPVGLGRIHYYKADLRTWQPPAVEYAFGVAFPPCTNLAVSGARWMKDKGIDGLSEALLLVERAREILNGIDAPWMLENPVSTLSTYWREPDYTFHPYEYDGYTGRDEAYSKKTCLWTGGGFEMPAPKPADEYDDRIHRMAPSDDRAERRSETPVGFSRALFEANSPEYLRDISDAPAGDSQHLKNGAAITDGGAEIKAIRDRDAVWLAVLAQLRESREPFLLADVRERLAIDTSDRTVNDVLNAMREAGLLAREDGGRLWRPGPELTALVGVSRSETVGFVLGEDRRGGRE